ncbi:MAG TPA: type II toxin-antitoxin system HipA family toxin [Acidothermaceae bacterium]|jgi:serine/threonine-protein kinase HipA
MPYEPVDLIEVRCWGATVGALALDPGSGFYVFEYDPAWSATGVQLAPTTMPVGGREQSFVFPNLPPRTYLRLPALIADALPDDFGNALTTAYLASEGVAAADITPLDRLAYLGRRGMGALEFRPGRGPRTRKATAVELSELVVAARSALAGELRTESATTAAIKHLIAVGTSAGGARAKAVVALNPNTNELRSGQVPVDPGFEPWLLKLDGVRPDLDRGGSGHYGRIEYAYSKMAAAAGIEMTACSLLEEGGRAHFMTRRFDRAPDGSKIHVQSLCALAHMDYKQIGAHDYAQLFLQIDALDLGAEARAEAFRRMVFNVAAANCDDHSKNFAFVLPEGGQWRLSPAYDLTHAYAPRSEWTHEHLMAVNGKRIGIDRNDIDTVGDRFRVPNIARVIEQVLAAVADWPRHAAVAGVPSDVTETVQADITTWSKPLH